MFKRLTRKQFARIIEPFAQQRTKNEKIWYDELYKLNNRIANAQKKGYQFTAENVIPKTPSRITQKAIDYLTSIRGTKLYSKADNPINPIVSDAEQYRVAKELAKNEKPYEAKAKDESQAIVSSLGKQKEDNTKTPAYTRDFCDPTDYGLPGPSVYFQDFPGKNTTEGCHFLLERIFPTQGSKPSLLHWQTDLSLSHQEAPNKPYVYMVYYQI